MMRVLFRCDASASIGTGHVVRCLALADELNQRGFAPSFAMRQWPGHMLAQVQAHGYPVLALEAGEGGLPLAAQRDDAHQVADAAETLRAADVDGALGDAPWDWVVVDHYALGAVWQQQMRPATRHLAAIDDLADRPHACDVLIDHNLQPPDRYDAWVPRQASRLLGPEYALLKPEFRGTGRVRVTGGETTALSTLVCFGGADEPGATLVAVGVLAEAQEALGALKCKVTMVAGARNAHLAQLGPMCRDAGFTLLAQTDEMAKLMAQADLAIGAGGGMLLERCAMGLPAIVLPIADNQRPGAQCAAQAGAIELLDVARPQWAEALRASLARLFKDGEARTRMSAAALQLCDGKGAVRVAQALQRGSLILRRAQASDSDALHQWRNAPQTRRHSGDDREISLPTHQQWLAATLANPARRLWIGEAGGRACGVVRFDRMQADGLTEAAQAEISVYLVPGVQGKGWGRALIACGVAAIAHEWPELHTVLARISDDNLASLRAFQACGFEPGTEPGIHRLLLQGHVS